MSKDAKILKYLKQLEAFRLATIALSDAWQEAQTASDTDLGNVGYPEYLPAFEEFTQDICVYTKNTVTQTLKGA